MGIETIAEYVDNPESLKQVREIGINYAQGFLLHQPEPLVCDQQECVSQPIYYRETESKNQPEKYVVEKPARKICERAVIQRLYIRVRMTN